MPMEAWLIGVDDTDMPGTRGTGHLVRTLAGELAARGFALAGVTRHQLLVHPDIRFTSHNSANCLEVEASDDYGAMLFTWACHLVAAEAREGADPGVCVARKARVGDGARRFGARAQAEVLCQEEGRRVAASEGHLLAGLAGTQDGMIGALAAVGLRAAGNDGRFIDLGTIRGLEGRVSVGELLGAGIAAVEGEEKGTFSFSAQQPWAPPGGGEKENVPSSSPRPCDRVETFGWVRPRLCRGQPILFVERSEDDGVEWVVCDRRSGKPKGAAAD